MLFKIHFYNNHVFQIMSDICLMCLGGRCYRVTGSCDPGDCELTPGYTGEDEGEFMDQRPMEDGLPNDIERMNYKYQDGIKNFLY